MVKVTREIVEKIAAEEFPDVYIVQSPHGWVTARCLAKMLLEFDAAVDAFCNDINAATEKFGAHLLKAEGK